MVVDAGSMSRRPYPAFGPASQQRRRTLSAEPGPAAIDAVAPRLDMAAQAIVGLYRACRLDGEPYPECFARLGAPAYAAILREALLRAA